MAKMDEIAVVLEKLNALWDANSAHILKANASLTELTKNISKIPSTYTAAVKGVADSQKVITESTAALKASSIETAKYAANYDKLILARDLALQKLQNTIVAEKASAAQIKKATKAYDELQAKVKAVYDVINKTQEKAAAKKAMLDEKAAQRELKAAQKQGELEEKRAAKVLANLEKERVAREKAHMKQISLAEKAAEADRKRFEKAAANAEKQLQRELKAKQKIADQEAKWSRTGSSSVIPGMGAKITNNKNNEKEALAVEHLSRAYVQLTAKRDAARNKLQDLVSTEKSSIANMSEHNKKLKEAQKEFDALEKKVQKADRAVGKLAENQSMLGKTLGVVGNLMAAFGISTGLYLAAELVKNIYSTTKELQSLDLALRMVGGSMEEFTENQAFINMIAEKWGLEVVSLTQQYTQFYTASKGLLTDMDIKSTFEGIAKAGSIMGLSVEKQTAAFYAFDQMMSKGTVSSEELKKQLGNAMPGAIKAAAMAYMGLHPEIKGIQEAEEELYAAMKKGAIASATYVPLIVKNFQKLYGIEMVDKVDTLAAAQNRLSNSWTNLIRTINGEQNTLIKSFTTLLSVLDMALEKLDRFASSDKRLIGKATDEGDAFGYAAIATMVQNNLTLEEAIKYRDRLINDLKELEADGYTPITLEDREAEGKKIGGFKGRIRALSEFIDSTQSPLTPATGGDGDGAKREKIKLNFDYIKSEYELKKAILERKMAESSRIANDESKSLADRIAARNVYIQQSLEMLDMEKQMQLLMLQQDKKEDIEKNDVAFKNKDLTAGEYGKNKIDIARKYKAEELKLEEEYSKNWSDLLYENFEFFKMIEDKKLEYKKRTSDAAYDYYKGELEGIVSSDSASDSQILMAAQQLREAELERAASYREAELKASSNEAEEKKAIWAEYAKKVTEINKKFNDTLEGQSQKRIDREKEITEYDEWAYGRTDALGNKTDGSLTGANSEVIKMYDALLEEYKKAIASKNKSWIDKAAADLEQFKGVVEDSKNMINGYLKGFLDEFGSNIGFSSLLQILNKEVDGFGKNWKDTFVGVAEIAQETVAFLAQNMSAHFDAQREALEQQYEYEIGLAGENEAARENIEKRYEERKRRLARREAKAQRDLAMFNVIIDTAQAVVSALPNIPLSVTVGILGAAQLAMIASRPLPQFYKGTSNAPEGFAITDERGPELHTDKYGRIKDFGSTGGARQKYLAAGDKIIPAHKTKNLLDYGLFSASMDELLFNNNILYNDDKNIILDTTGIISSIHSLQQSIMNKETSEEHYDIRGFSKFKKINGQRIEEKNNRIRFKKNIL